MPPQASGSSNEELNTTVADKQPANRSVALLRRLHRFLGFQKAYNFSLFIIFAGALFGFTLARLSYLNISGPAKSSFANGASPGEWYWYRTGHYRVGITIHLGCILPASLLMIWQFVPKIRQKALLFHRINGYLIILLVLVSNVGALMIVRRAFGGGLDTQAATGLLVILTTVSLCMAYYNIKRLRIDQHRAWMLRAVFYLGAIITTRIILIIATQVISKVGTYYSTLSCDEIVFMHRSLKSGQELYPQCFNGTALPSELVVVKANFKGPVEEIGVGLGMTFGMSLWLSLIIHLVGVEIYLNLTPKEGQRLRKVSHEKQLEAGYEHSGSVDVP